MLQSYIKSTWSRRFFNAFIDISCTIDSERDGLPLASRPERATAWENKMKTTKDTYSLQETNESARSLTHMWQRSTLSLISVPSKNWKNLIRDIVLGVVSKATRNRLLATDKLTKKSCIHICRGDNIMESQMTSLLPIQPEDSDTEPDTTVDDRNPQCVTTSKEHGRPVHAVNSTRGRIKHQLIVFHVLVHQCILFQRN